MLFMGEEHGSRTPFHYFTDHNEELAQAVREGRKREFEHEDHDGDPLALDPNAPETFEASRPQPGDEADEWLALYRELIDIRRSLIVPDLDDCGSAGAEPLGAQAVKAAWRLGGRSLVLLANFADEPVETALPAGRPIFSLGVVAAQADRVKLEGPSFLAILSD